MTTKLKMFVSTLPLLFAAVSVSASASSYYNPDDGNTGGCAAATYQNTQDSGETATFSVPAMQNGTAVMVYGWVYNRYGQASQISTSFSCTNGTLDGAWGYETSDSYSWW
jgi:hypothetical protein